MAHRSSPPFDGSMPRPNEWDLVIKVKYGDTLKRFNAYVNGSYFDMNLADLRSKITRAFKFGPNVDFVLTYTDEDGDIVMLDDDDDLRDAAIHQKLNPLRIKLQLKSSSLGASQTKERTSNSTPLRSTVLEDQLAQVRSAIDEVLKAIPEAAPSVFAKLFHDLLSRATSSASALTELLDHYAKLMTPNSNTQPSNAPADGSFGSSSGVSQASVNLKANDEPKDMTPSVSRPLDVQNSEPSKVPVGLKSVLVEAPVAPGTKAPQDQQASGYPSIDVSLFSTNSCGKEDAQSKWKSVISSAAPPVAPKSVISSNAALPVAPKPVIASNAAPPVALKSVISSSTTPHVTHSVQPPAAPGNACSAPPRPSPPHFTSIAPMVPPFPSSPHLPLEANGKISGDPFSTFPAPLPYSYSPTFHKWIHCDGCGAQPIVGPRYKSNMKVDYGLCSTCFSHIGNEAEYTRIDKSAFGSRLRDTNKLRRLHSRIQTKSNREKLESRFITDVTVLDGTLMAPSTTFTKIWRMRNNGSTMWPFGTQLIWVGGDQFALHNSVQLEIPVSGFPVDQEIDVTVDCVAPARPGRYISYWRLVSPSGQKFGQRVWVLIQVEQPDYTNGNKHTGLINLNLPPESISTEMLIDINAEPIDPFFGDFVDSTKVELVEPTYVAMQPMESVPPPSSVPSVPATAIPPVVDPIIGPSSSTATASTSTPVDMFAPEPSLPVSEPVYAPPPASDDQPEPAPFGARAPAPVNIDSLREEKLLRELEEMGFRQVDLNKEVLRQNKYDLEQSLDDLCGFSEWDPLLTELNEMGFDDSETNKELLAKDGGSIKRAVIDLVAREKKEQ